MPNLDLSSGEVSDLIEYLEEESKTQASRAATPPTAVLKNAAMP